MWIADFRNYKDFLLEHMKTYPKKGRGLSSKLARHLNTTPMVISLILAGERHFTLDQAVQVAAFFSLDENASEYFVYLVGHARSETKQLRSFYEAKMAKLKQESLKLKANVVGKEFLTEQEKGIFYSNWYYSAILMLITNKNYQTVEAIAGYFHDLPKGRVVEAVSFLISTGVCTDDGGRIKPGQTSIFIAEPHPQLNNHRRNWRLKAIEAFPKHKAGNIHYSSPVSISEKDAEIVQKQIVELIKDFSARVKPSPEEKLMCLNIDWFDY